MQLLVQHLDHVVDHFILIAVVLVVELCDEELVLVGIRVVEIVLLFDVLLDTAIEVVALKLALDVFSAMFISTNMSLSMTFRYWRISADQCLKSTPVRTSLSNFSGNSLSPLFIIILATPRMPS